MGKWLGSLRGSQEHQLEVTVVEGQESGSDGNGGGAGVDPHVSLLTSLTGS